MDSTYPPVTDKFAVAVVTAVYGDETVTVGASVYPYPGFVTIMFVREPPDISATPSALEFNLY